MITNQQSGTNIDEIADGIYRINTPVALPGGGRVHLQPVPDRRRRAAAVPHRPARAVPAGARGHRRHACRWRRCATSGLSHVEADECGALNELLAAAPQAEPLCSRVAAMVSIGDLADRPPRALADGEALHLGRHTVRWFDTPHLPHGWDCGFLMEERTGTLLCGDLFTQGGGGEQPLTEADILGPSEAFRQAMDYFAHRRRPPPRSRSSRQQPTTLACMHGSAWRGDGAGLLRELAATLVVSQNRAQLRPTGT